MRHLLLALFLGLFSFLVDGCTFTSPSEQKIDVSSITPTIPVLLIPTRVSTPTLLPRASETPTAIAQRFDVAELVPSSRCGIIPNKQIFTVSWVNDDKFIYAYHPVVEEGGESSISEGLQWTLHNANTSDEIPGLPNINFDNDFWKRNQIEINAIDPELAGYFSPSGKYVIYRIFIGKSFEPGARNEIWVAEVNGQQKWKIYESGGNAVDIYRAAWFDNETKVIFNIAYEGPTEFYISDFKSGKTDRLSEISQFSGVTEETWRLSPDGNTLAVVDWNGQLLLVTLKTGEMQVVESYGGSFPQWSDDGEFLFYWWRADKDNWRDTIDELRVYDLRSQKTSALLDKTDLVAGFRDYQDDDNCISRDYYLLGGSYAVSPDQKSILLWDIGLYLLTKK